MIPLNVPIWCQNRDPLPDGAQDPFASTDCGEECAAMVISYRKGIALPAGTVRTLIPGHSDHGETTSQDLMKLLELFDLAPIAVEATITSLQGQTTAALYKGSPVIMLGNWLSLHILHWVVAVGYGGGKMLFNEPFYGQRRSESWDWVRQRSAMENIVT